MKVRAKNDRKGKRRKVRRERAKAVLEEARGIRGTPVAKFVHLAMGALPSSPDMLSSLTLSLGQAVITEEGRL